MRAARALAALGAAFVLLYAGFVLGQQSAPTDYKLVSEDVLAKIDLAKEIDSVEGRELRLSSAVIAPDGHVGLHSHRGDPTIPSRRKPGPTEPKLEPLTSGSRLSPGRRFFRRAGGST